MHRATAALTIAFALAMSACAADPSGQATDETTTTAAPTTTTVVESTTTAPGDTGTTTSTATETTSTTTAAPPASSDLDELVERIAGSPELVSGRMEGSIEVSGLDPAESGVSEMSIFFATAFDATTGDGSFLMDFSSLEDAVDIDEDDPFAALAAGLLGTMEFRQVGDRAYMNAPFFGVFLGAETTWISMPAEDGAELSSGFETVPSDPQEIIDAYDGANATVEDLGTEQVNGTTATHYRVVFDTSAMIAELSPEERAELEESGVFADGILPMDLWISDDGYLVRMVVEIDGSTASDFDGDSFEKMRLRYDVFDLNGAVSIEAPPASDVTPIEDLEDIAFDFGLDA